MAATSRRSHRVPFNRMCLIDTPLTATEVLRAYHHDEVLLFLASAFITVGIVSAALCVIRRRFDPLLVSLALFAYLYGQRLRFDSEILRISVTHNNFFFNLRTAINYLVPIQAFAFFEAAGFLGRKGKTIVIVLGIVFLGLVIGTFIFGPLDVFEYINNGIIIAVIPAVALRSHLMRNSDRDFAVVRIGLICFIVPSIRDNVIGTIWLHHKMEYRLEPYGFAIFLASLGYVAARRLVRRDLELGEMRNELELARNIQLSILPAAFPESARFCVAARYVPMTAVAGDFYDYLHVDATHAGILIADVSGHGVPAALIASMVKMAATSQRAHIGAPAQLLTGMNEALCGNTQNQFVTAAYVHLDAEAGEFRYAAAGHPPMLLLRDGHVTEIMENGLILAILANAEYTQLVQPLLPGDRLVLYTDGIIEAKSGNGEFFGEDRLYATVQETAKLPPSEVVNRIIRSVEKWAPVQDDDLTVLVCDFTG
jgi:phosphoserine phosphatase RsbU/P